ncbi:MAG: flagellin [Planctomycetota bacterium]
MSSFPVSSRTSTLSASDLTLSQLQRTQREMLENQRQTSSGLAIARPSDGADRVGAVLQLRQNISRAEQQERALQNGLGALDTADTALGETAQILREATAVASSQIGVGSDAETRAAQSLVIDASLEGMLVLANRQFADLSVFGGDNGAAPGEKVFESFLGGVRYLGGTDDLFAPVGALDPEEITGNGVDAFGAFSTRVEGVIDLDPAATAGTRLSEVVGAQGRGIRLGSIQVDVDGTTAVVDLNGADTLGDVADRINNAIAGIDAAAGSLAVSADGFTLNAAAGRTVSVTEVGTGQAAGDLGVLLSATSGAAVGPDVGVKLTGTTALADLGAGVDLTSGLVLTQGAVTATADFSAATTIEDLVNTVAGLDLGVRLEINANRDGLNLVNEVSGLSLSIGENGGTTATDLGLRSLDRSTELTNYRDGLGVSTTDAGVDDLEIALHDGTTFTVDLFGSATVGEVEAAIEAAAAAAGVAVPGAFDVGFAATGNGLTLTDNTAGAGSFAVRNAGRSTAGDELGLTQDVGAGATIDSGDQALVRNDNAFTHLIDLRDALRTNDESGITFAGENLVQDTDRLVESRARIAIQSQRLEDQQTRLADRVITEQTMLSNLQDADLTEVLTEFSRLQLQLQASLQAGAQNLQLNLLNFLR